MMKAGVGAARVKLMEPEEWSLQELMVVLGRVEMGRCCSKRTHFQL